MDACGPPWWKVFCFWLWLDWTACITLMFELKIQVSFNIPENFSFTWSLDAGISVSSSAFRDARGILLEPTLNINRCVSANDRERRGQLPPQQIWFKGTRGRHQNLTENRYLYSVKIEGEGVRKWWHCKDSEKLQKSNLLSNKLLGNTCSGLYTPKTIFWDHFPLYRGEKGVWWLHI